MTISLNFDASKFTDQGRELLTKGAGFGGIIRKALRKSASFGYQNLRDRLRSGTGEAPRYNTGTLFRSFQLSGFESGTDVEVGVFRIFSDLNYAAVHEKGTKGKGGELDDIVSSRGPGKFLARPLKKALEERESSGFFLSSTEFVEVSGTALTKAGRLQGRFAGRSLRDSKELFVFKSQSGKLFLAIPGKKKRPLKLLFRLLAKVSIKPRPYLRPTTEAIADHINTEFPRNVNDLLSKPAAEFPSGGGGE